MAAKKKGNGAGKTKGTNDLQLAFAALDVLWRERVPALALRPGSATAASAVAKAVGAELPEEIVAWFAWHDGQSSSEALSDESNFTLHSAESAAQAYAFLCSEAEGFEASWIPLFENGGGDHRVYDLTTGALVSYWHDDRDRPVEFPSLLAWAEATRAALAKTRPPAKAPKLSLGGLTWKKLARAPADVGAHPVGSVFHYTMRLPMGVRHAVVVKLAPDKWLAGSGAELEGALSALAQHLEKSPGKSSGYWKGDGAIAYDLKTYPRGLREARASGVSEPRW